MKINRRTFAFAIALCSAGAGQAQFRYFLGYGDSNLAHINSNANPGASVGSEIPVSGALRVPTSGQNFKLQLWVEKIGGGSDDLYAGISSMLSFDRANAHNTGDLTTANMLDHKIGIGGSGATLSDQIVASISEKASFSTFSNTGAANGSTMIGFMGAALRGEYRSGSAASVRGAGFGGQSTLTTNGVGSFFKLPVGSTTKLFTFELTSYLSASEYYGENNGRTGINLFVNGTAAQQAGAMTYIHSQNGQSTGVHLNVQGVPEPGSIVAIFAGLAALGLRRRSK